MSYKIETQLEIAASADRVWQALIQFSEYQNWNSFIPFASGAPVQGNTIDLVIHVPGEKKSKYKVKIIKVTHGIRLEWLGSFLIPGLIDGHHIFEVQGLGPQLTRVVHNESFRGLVVPFVWRSFLNTKLRAGLELLNRNLKQHLESSRES